MTTTAATNNTPTDSKALQQAIQTLRAIWRGESFDNLDYSRSVLVLENTLAYNKLERARAYITQQRDLLERRAGNSELFAREFDGLDYAADQLHAAMREVSRERDALLRKAALVPALFGTILDESGSMDLAFYFVPALALLSALRSAARICSK